MTTNNAGKRTNQKQKHPREPALWNTASVLKRNAVVWSGDFVADERAFDPAGRETQYKRAVRRFHDESPS
jgi:hypothetical protein